jgi:hypothetical protein
MSARRIHVDENALCAEVVALAALIQPDTRNSFLLVGNLEVIPNGDLGS